MSIVWMPLSEKEENMRIYRAFVHPLPTEVDDMVDLTKISDYEELYEALPVEEVRLRKYNVVGKKIGENFFIIPNGYEDDESDEEEDTEDDE